MVTQITTGGTQPCRAACIGLLVGLMVTLMGGQATAQRPPEGTLTLGMAFTITPALLNPAETTGQTAAMFHYALHDALLKPLPGLPMAPALAESWTESPDGRTYEFTLRQGLTFHNGDPFTAADVTFSFGRYQGVFAALLHEKVQAVEIRDPHHVRFVLQAPWPDFLTVYSALVSGAGWIMPKAYTEQVGEAGYPQGFDAGDLTPFPLFVRVAEAVGNDLGAVGIRTHLRTLERTTWTRAWREKQLKGLVLAASPTLGNAATRIEIYVLGTGPGVYGSDADLDALFQEQAGARDPTTREALLHRLQALLHERVRHAPLLEQAVLIGVGPRVEEPAIGLMPLVSFTAPYEEMRLKRP